MDVYFRGERLYGDDFTPQQLAEWYADEKEGYADLGAKDTQSYRYEYHGWNRHHAFRHLPPGPLRHVLGFGSAYGDELLPIIDRIQQITIVDPSAAFVTDTVHGVPAKYVQPTEQGTLPLPNDEFDLITCLGVLHHIANVSFVMQELARVLRPGGYLALREPIVSMGDWRQPRRGLTKRERGIPLPILKEMIQRHGLRIVRQGYCAFPLTTRLFRPFGIDPYNSNIIARFDQWMASSFAWNLVYHANSSIQKIRPTSIYLLIQKRKQ